MSIDHRNRDPSDNRWANLPRCTPSENSRNDRGHPDRPRLLVGDRTTSGNTNSEHGTPARQEGDNLQRQHPPPSVCDSHPIDPDEPPPTAHDSLLQGRVLVANQIVQRSDSEAVCQHERFCAASRRAGEPASSRSASRWSAGRAMPAPVAQPMGHAVRATDSWHAKSAAPPARLSTRQGYLTSLR